MPYKFIFRNEIIKFIVQGTSTARTAMFSCASTGYLQRSRKEKMPLKKNNNWKMNFSMLYTSGKDVKLAIWVG
jgi:hypothetical protein